MLDYGKLSQTFTTQICNRPIEIRKALRGFVAVSFMVKSSSIHVPAFARVDDVLMLTQIERVNHDRMPDRGVEDIDTFTSTVKLVDDQVNFGHELVRYRNLAVRPTYEKRPGAYSPAESPGLNEALTMDATREELVKVVSSGGFAPSVLAMPQLMAGYKEKPTVSLRAIPLSPETNSLGLWLVPKSEVTILGAPDEWCLDMRTWRGREFPNELGCTLPVVDNPLEPIIRELFPNLDNPDLGFLPEEQQAKVMEEVDRRCPDIPDDMLVRACRDFRAKVRVSPGYGISVEEALSQCRRQLSVYGHGAADADILDALANQTATVRIAGAPKVQVFRWRNSAVDYFAGSAHMVKFCWPVPGKDDPAMRPAPREEALVYSRSEWDQIRRVEDQQRRQSRKDFLKRQAARKGIVVSEGQPPQSEQYRDKKRSKRSKKNKSQQAQPVQPQQPLTPEQVEAKRQKKRAKKREYEKKRRSKKRAQRREAAASIENAAFQGSTTDFQGAAPTLGILVTSLTTESVEVCREPEVVVSPT